VKSTRLTLSEEDSGSAVDKDTLLHGETLLVVATVDSENVALKVISQNVAVDFLTHTSVEEGAAVQNSWMRRCTRKHAERLRLRGCGEALTCVFHHQFQFSFDHRWWGPKC